MLKPYKKTLILTSLLTLLPILVGLLLRNYLPETFATHWNLYGQADGWMNASAAIILPPLLMLAAHLFCIFFTLRDPGNKGRNKKPLKTVFWILPVVSNMSCYVMFALAMGLEFSPVTWTVLPLGLMFTIIGNMLPKCRMNSTMGIKVPWTYSSEENWNATHRFSGKVWVIGGIGMILSSLLPGAWGVTVMLIAILLLAVVPIVYSYLYYRRQKQEGIAQISIPKISKTAWIAVVLLLVFLGAVLFSGSIETDFRENYLYLDSSYYSSYVVEYEDILDVEFREGNVDGIRVGGYGSFRLLMGYFQNEEFGTYVRYTYYKPESCVVLTTQGRTIVLSGETKAETEAIYQELLERTK